ncbi:MAG: hypothetical protein Ta2A_12790 [Treponemataceae bacterium]|nr:MAG: hypothetical protein Ta2A_12790 [Treponemataceae bacterium]
MQKTHNMAKADNLLEITLILPEADIKGLHFNEAKVKAVFEQKDDGCYYSRDILFCSARRSETEKTEDVLTEYLETLEFRTAIFDALPQALKPASASGVNAFIPEYEYGRTEYEKKHYNGGACRYWLRPSSAAVADKFCCVSIVGSVGTVFDHLFGGCAPAFRIENQH